MFHSTPGRLTGDHSSFLDTPTPRPAASVQIGLSGDITAEIATHVHHLSPNPSAPLPPVDPSNQLPSSPSPYSNGRFNDNTRNKVTPRRPRKRLEEAFSGQTATPPKSTSKGARKLAPKIAIETMQNDPQDGRYGLPGAPIQAPDFSDFPLTSAEMFNFPLSAPATAVGFDPKQFWEADAGMGGMDLDFSAEDTAMFNNGHKLSNSFDWGRNNQMFQEENMSLPALVQPQNPIPKKQPPVKRQRPLAPKVTLPIDVQSQKSLPAFNFNNNSTNTIMDNPFGDSVDPGLIYSRKNSMTMTSGFEDVVLPPERPATSHLIREPYQHQMQEARRDEEELRRARSSRERSSGRSFGRETVSSPVKGSARPRLGRSNSDSTKKPQGNLNWRFGVETLTLTTGRIPPRAGRSSPVKNQRTNALTSIAESPQAGPRTEVVFTIDSKGKARTREVVVGRESSPTKVTRPSSVEEDWYSSPYESSTDEEPIVIPSRNSSFSLPQQSRGPKLARFETSISNDGRRQSLSNSGYSQSESSGGHADGLESEAETAMEEDDGSGDATRELRKIRENRKKAQMMKQQNPRHHHFAQDTRGNYYNSSTNLSPSTITDTDGATPTSSRSGTTRCVCGKPEDDRFMIQW